MPITLLGVTGIGLIWGWLSGRLLFWLSSMSYKGFVFGVESMLLSIQIYLFTDWLSLIFFWGATMFALMIHVGWLRRLRARFGLSDFRGRQ